MLHLRFQILCAAVVAVATVQAGTTVQATTPDALQSAIDACDSGCRIELSAPLYTLTKPIRIEGKCDLQIVGTGSVRPVLRWDASLLEKVTNPWHSKSPAITSKVARLFTLSWKDMTGVEDPLRPAGWLMWPYQYGGGSDSASMGGSKNTYSPYSTSGAQHNGMVFIHASKDVLIGHLELDGVKATAFGNSGVWGSGSLYFGNVGLNMFQTLRTHVVDCDIHHFWSTVYSNGRNNQCFFIKNAGDLDAATGYRFASCAQVGDHLVENSRLHDSWLGVYAESEWDQGSVLRANLAWNLSKDTSDYTSSYSDPLRSAPGGGFLLLKDVIDPKYVVSGNTLWKVVNPITAEGGWRAGPHTIFADNLVGPVAKADFNEFSNILANGCAPHIRRNTFMIDSSSKVYKDTLLGAIVSQGRLEALDPLYRATHATGATYMSWAPVRGRSYQAQGLIWFDALALDSAAPLLLPAADGVTTTDTTDNRICIGCAFASLDPSNGSFLAPFAGEASPFDSLAFASADGRWRGAVVPAASASARGLLWSAGVPGMDTVTWTLHLPLRLAFAADGSAFVPRSLYVVKSSESDAGTEAALAVGVAAARYDAVAQELVVPLAGLVDTSTFMLQADLWGSAVLGGDTLPLTPATWSWGRHMNYASGRLPSVGLSVRTGVELHVWPHGRAGHWNIDISGIADGAALRLVDAGGRSAAFAQTRTGANRRRLEISGVHAGTWFLKAPAFPAQRVFLAP